MHEGRRLGAPIATRSATSARAAWYIIVLTLVVSACAPKAVPLPTVSTPRFPDFMAPAVPLAYANSPASVGQDRGWRFLQAGDLKNAEREFSAALQGAPAFYPADVSLGYVELADKDPKAALVHFDRVLERGAAELSALIGRGLAYIALERERDALTAFEAALAVDASLGDVARRVDVLRFRTQQQELTNARQAARAGRVDEARSLYMAAIAGSPDSPFLYRELADVERQNGDVDAALEHFRKSVDLDPTDARSLGQIGEILESRDDFEGAVKAYSDALALETNPAVEDRLDRVRARIALARLPEEYRAIAGLSQVSRADLAALIGVRLSSLLQADRRRDVGPSTDIRNHWAQGWIIAVTGAGIMDPFANHTFQPRAVVRRVDLAQAVGRLLPRVVPPNPAQAQTWTSARLQFSDLSPGHLAYAAVSQAVASGVMTTDADGSFQPSKPVSGAEAVDAIARLEALAGLASSR